ncbi:MAG: hypothetical protein ACTIJN_11105, partial [Microbacterium gubbeenense]
MIDETGKHAAAGPALAVCLVAPALFVFDISWLGWLLAAVALVLAWIVDRRTGVASFRRGGSPSLLRDVSLIAVGLLVVSSVPLAAELDNAAMLR